MLFADASCVTVATDVSIRMLAGNNTVEGNLLFASVRETADHVSSCLPPPPGAPPLSYASDLLFVALLQGPVNTWNRMPYWTLNGVDDGFGNWSNISKPHPLASAVKQYDHIRRNFIFTDFGGSRSLDHDDGK